MRRALIVIGKAPIAGRTKTRLVPPLTVDDAAALYRGFLLDTLQLARGLRWESTTLVHPRGDDRFLRELTPHGVELLAQRGDGLGAALAFAFEHLFAEGSEAVVLIGSDNPTLPPAPIGAAEAALSRGSDMVIGPTVDGGYYLIGMRQPHLGIFEQIDWSTPRVYLQTLNRARQLRLSVQTVAAWYDVDEPADLERLQRELASSPPSLAPNTRLALEAMRVVPAP